MNQELIETIEEIFMSLENKPKALFLQRFFKTGKGEYGEGDCLLGINVPQVREIVTHFKHHITLEEIGYLITSKWHEIRLFAILCLIFLYQQISKSKKISLDMKRPKHEELFYFYLHHIPFINNWDLVDISSRNIVGEHLLFYFPKDKQQHFLSQLCSEKKIYVSKHKDKLWEKRVAILATFQCLINKQPENTILVCEMALKETHDLLHKASGWMLREMGKRCGINYLMDFLEKNYKLMPRTMLRYAIEKLDKHEKKYWLHRDS